MRFDWSFMLTAWVVPAAYRAVRFDCVARVFAPAFVSEFAHSTVEETAELHSVRRLGFRDDGSAFLGAFALAFAFAFALLRLFRCCRGVRSGLVHLFGEAGFLSAVLCLRRRRRVCKVRRVCDDLIRRLKKSKEKRRIRLVGRMLRFHLCVGSDDETNE